MKGDCFRDESPSQLMDDVAHVSNFGNEPYWDALLRVY
jgi:hypothetical protein